MMGRMALTMALSAALLSGCSTEGDLPPQAVRASAPSTAHGIFVSRGDTLYRLAEQYNVPLRDLIEANGLTPPYTLSPGQRLTLPAPRTYTVKAGDTLYGLSRQFQVDMTDLVRANDIQPPYGVKVGQTLRLPGRTSAVPPAVTTTMATTRPAPVPPPRKPEAQTGTSSSPAERSQRPAIEVVTLPPPAPAVSAPVAAPPSISVPPTRPSSPASTAPTATGVKKGVEAETLAPPLAAAGAAVSPAERRPATELAPPPPAQVATATPPAAAVVKADNPPARGGSRFLWPVRGSILSGFGDKPGGLRNDGINISAARGTAVAASDNGIVAYAGNQLKSFGNLVLIRHDGGWVTVYAHLDDIAVEQGQRVSRGQGIGTVGQTGNVRAPQLHFAIRKGEQVVNPVDQLEK